MFDPSDVVGLVPYLLFLAAGVGIVFGANMLIQGLRRRTVPPQLRPAIPRVERGETPGVYELFEDKPNPSVLHVTETRVGSVAQKIRDRINKIDTKPAVGATTTAGVTIPGAASVLAPGSNLVTARDVRTIVTAALTSAIVARRQKFGWTPPLVKSQ
jgi:hypothetical protein